MTEHGNYLSFCSIMATGIFRPPISAPLPEPRRSMAATCTSSSALQQRQRKLPILLFDVMDTLVRDPFYHDIPAFFQMSMEQLLEEKHPTAWIEFEKGLINEDELARKFFKDGRSFDLQGLKECMVRGYSYVDGIEALLQSLKQNNYQLHAFTNYPIWYMLIEEKLKLSKYLSWTFCSCKIDYFNRPWMTHERIMTLSTGKRKPASDSYIEVLQHLGVEPASCIFVDDRMTNVEAAKDAGMVCLHFRNTDALKQDLVSLGIDLAT